MTNISIRDTAPQQANQSSKRFSDQLRVMHSRNQLTGVSLSSGVAHPLSFDQCDDCGSYPKSPMISLLDQRLAAIVIFSAEVQPDRRFG
ncbi:hypothetical protein [Pseudomonas putida]|uniref:Uncharacterized protein n=1 Tax=Pseudomonas putida TaxID=303 RepID=A0A8I1EJS6_PSEPU|nr:hypothetical protein [Pseudomonas putida]MBI6886472.1 hypothetical protein [Pseudomonas putida]